MDKLLPDSIQDTHIKSLLDSVFEESQKKLASMRKDLTKDPSKLAQKERLFLINECAKLDNISRLQIRMDEYRAKHAHTSPKQKAAEALRAGNSDILGQHLRAIGQFKPNKDWQAHHIVCTRHRSHAAARFKLFAYMGINDPFNGCWLPRKHQYARGTTIPNAVGHAYVHTDKYARWVGTELRPARDKQDIVRRLNAIRLKLHNTKHLPDVLTDKGKNDLRTL